MANVNHYRIGEASRLSGVSTGNIRHYEREGLLNSSVRAADNQYRYYSEADTHALRLIRLCRSMNMSLEEVAQIMRLDETSAQDCALAVSTITEHLNHVKERMRELQQLAQKLEKLLTVCDGQQQTCHLIEALHKQAAEMAVGESPAPSAKPRHV